MIYGRLRGADEVSLRKAIAIEQRTWRGTKPFMIFLIDRDRPWRAGDGEDGFESLHAAYAELAEEEQLAGQRVVKIANDK